jgi:protein TonB
MLHWRDVGEPDDPGAAVVIDLAPMLVAPTNPQSDLPPGPEQVETESTIEKPIEKVEEKLELEPTPTVTPEIPVAQAEPEPEPKDNTPAPETTAPSAPKVGEAAVAAAPSLGQLNLSNSNAVPAWKRQVINILERNKRYPAAAQARGEPGVVELAFSLDRQGRVTASRITRGSGSAALDQAALGLLQRAQPFPPPPAELPGAQVSLTVPIRFNIR